MDKQHNLTQRNLVNQVKELSDGAIDMTKDADLLAAYHVFKDPDIFPYANKQALLSAGGAVASPGTLLKQLAVQAVSPVVGPAAMKKYIQGGQAVGKQMDRVPPVARKIPPYLATNELFQLMYPGQNTGGR